jgi:chitinase
MPSATASAVPQTPSTVTVTYALVESWDGGLLGEFTVVNDGSTTIPGWELAATFPGDQIQVTWGPIDPNPGGDSLVMQAQPDSPTIAPGASQTGYFIARGDTAFPSSCTFDGASCTAYGDPGQPVS